MLVLSSTVKLSDNGGPLCEGGDFETKNFKLAQWKIVALNLN
jgi:hypothetical protein